MAITLTTNKLPKKKHKNLEWQWTMHIAHNCQNTYKAHEMSKEPLKVQGSHYHFACNKQFNFESNNFQIHQLAK